MHTQNGRVARGIALARWRVNRPTPDQLVFHRGGDSQTVFWGVCAVIIYGLMGMGVLIGTFDHPVFGLGLIWHNPRAVLDALEIGSIFDLLGLSFLSAVAIFGLALGFWSIFSRTVIILDRKSGWLTKSRCLLSVVVQERKRDIRSASRVTLARLPVFIGMFRESRILLHTHEEPPFRLNAFVRPGSSAARELALEVASFLGVPGPG